MNPGTCALCGADNKRTKLVSCLHSLCLLCLDQCIEDSVIICPTCTATALQPGCAAAVSLPDNCFTGHSSTGRLRSVPSNDERADEEVAVCDTQLCDERAQNHKRPRATKEHTLESLDRSAVGATASAAQPAHICALHTTKTITHFCHECQRPMCQRCIDTKTHELHEDALVPIGEAAKKMRGLVRENLSTCASGENVGLETAKEKVTSTITALKDQMKCASEYAKEFFRAMMTAVKARETIILDRLDHLRTQKLAPLEKQLRTLEEGISQTDKVIRLVHASHDDVDFTKMANWLNTAVTTAKQVATDHSEPCSAGSIVFAGTDVSDVLDGIENSGLCVDLVESTLSNPENTMVDCDTVISIDVSQHGTNLPVSQELLSRIDLQVAVTHSSGRAAPCPPLRRSSDGQCLQTTCCPTQDGQHIVSATIGGTHLNGSPARFIAGIWPTFDANYCHGSLQLSNRNQTVCKAKDAKVYKYAYSIPILDCGGSSQAQFCINHYTRHGNILICAIFCDEPDPTVPPKPRTCFGWFAGRDKFNTFTGAELGQPWRSGDEITLTINHDEHTLTGHHHRTGITEVLRNLPTGKMRWCVQVCDIGAKVTMM